MKYYPTFEKWRSRVVSEQKHYAAFRGVELRNDWLMEAYSLEIRPIDFLNNLISDCC